MSQCGGPRNSEHQYRGESAKNIKIKISGLMDQGGGGGQTAELKKNNQDFF